MIINGARQPYQLDDGTYEIRLIPFCWCGDRAAGVRGDCCTLCGGSIPTGRPAQAKARKA